MAKLLLPDKRMLELMDFVISNKVKGVGTKGAFFKSLGFVNAGNLSQIKKGLHSFRNEHLMKAVKVYNVDANFFLDETHYAMLKVNEKKTPLQLLNEAVKVVSLALKEAKTEAKQ